MTSTRVLCSLAELDETGSRGFAVGEGDWPLRGFLVRTANGVAAYVNTCPHAGHPLNFKPDRFLTPDRNLILCSFARRVVHARRGAVYRRPVPGPVADGECR